MSEARHTPGPWSVCGPYQGNEVPVSPGDDASPDFVPNGWICLVNRSGRGYDPSDPFREENEANARLIAAAPDLLAALVELLDAYEDGVDQCVCKEYRENLGKPPVPEDFCTACLAKAAIAKATTGVSP